MNESSIIMERNPISLPEIISGNSQQPYLLPAGYTLVSGSSSNGNWLANQFPAGGKTSRAWEARQFSFRTKKQ
jgi:hypothetical protein